MSNVLQFYIQLKDMMSGGLVRVAQQSRQSLGTVQQMADSASRSVGNLSNSMDNAGRSTSGLTRNLMGFVTAAGLLAGSGSAIKSAMDFQATKTSFEVLTGSKDTGNALAGGLNKLQQDTILGPEVFKQAQTMMGFGIAVEKVIPTMKMLGDVSMGDANKMQSLTLAFSQISAGGKLTGQDLLQLINAGFNPLKQISESTGESIGHLKEKMEKGLISFDMVEGAFKRATSEGGLYNNMLNKLAETPYGKLQQLMGQFEALKVKVGEALMPIAEMLMKLGGLLMDNIDIVIAGAVAWGTYALATGAAGTAQAILNAIMALNPIILIISLIAGLIVWVIYMIKTNEKWGNSFKGLWEIIKGFVKLNAIGFRDMYQAIAYYIQLSWYKVQGFFEYTAGVMNNISKAFDFAKSGQFSDAKAALTATITTNASKQISELEKVRTANLLQSSQATKAASQQILGGMMLLGKGKSGSGASSLTPSLANAAGLNAAGGGGAGGDGANSPTARTATGAGPRNIYISGVKFAETVNINGGSAGEARGNSEEWFNEMFLRLLQSGARVR
jgi:tape measure domain-containing protein